MGENQGMVWIILGVIIVGAVIIVLSQAMEGQIEDTSTKVEAGNVVTP